MNLSKPVYCKSALFTCTCCGYSAEIYADTEYLVHDKNTICKKCKRAYHTHFELAFIYRDDIDELPLHPQETSLPNHLQDCNECIKRSDIHWTEVLASCPHCYDHEKIDTMVFSHYVQAKHILKFYEECVDRSKPSYPYLFYTLKDGHEYIYIDPFYNSISAS